MGTGRCGPGRRPRWGARAGPGRPVHLGMAILREARGQGGGRALLQAILDHAEANGAHKLELEVWIDNARAIALYASAGFEVEGLRRNHYRRLDGSLRSALVMARLLESSVSPEGRGWDVALAQLGRLSGQWAGLLRRPARGEEQVQHDQWEQACFGAEQVADRNPTARG